MTRSTFADIFSKSPQQDNMYYYQVSADPASRFARTTLYHEIYPKINFSDRMIMMIPSKKLYIRNALWLREHRPESGRACNSLRKECISHIPSALRFVARRGKRTVCHGQTVRRLQGVSNEKSIRCGCFFFGCKLDKRFFAIFVISRCRKEFSKH